MTVEQALAAAALRLGEAGIDSALLDAELLLRHVTGWNRAAVLSRGRDPLAGEAEARFQTLVADRATRRPLQHLTGTQAFWRHDFVITPAVLIPRPDTEVLVETALEVLRDVRHPRVVDVGTGSGCIALSLAAERPDAEVHATDVSAAALEVARENALRLHLALRVTFHEGDLLDPVAHLAGSVDLVVSNPPYVSAEEMPGLTPEVRDHDPRIALVPEEGVGALYLRLFEGAAPLLRPRRWVAVEIGAGQAEEIGRVAHGAGLVIQKVVPDLQGIGRVVLAALA